MGKCQTIRTEFLQRTHRTAIRGNTGFLHSWSIETGRCNVSEAMRKRNRIEAGRRERLALAITAACSVALSGRVIASLIYLLLALASLMAVRPAFAQTAPVGAGVLLEAGIEKEDVDGELKSAMDIYQKIAADTSAPRDVRAKALLRLAGCDEKLGKQAKQVYEQIVHDYADQPAAAQARLRLALISQQEHPALPSTMSVRKIETSNVGQVDAWPARRLQGC